MCAFTCFCGAPLWGVLVFFSLLLPPLSSVLQRVPSLAIHLDRSVSEGFSYNKETHLAPILVGIV